MGELCPSMVILNNVPKRKHITFLRELSLLSYELCQHNLLSTSVPMHCIVVTRVFYLMDFVPLRIG
jgi:hypothetical protein